MANIVQSARAFGIFTALLEVLEASGLRDPLRHAPCTLLAPLDEAFYQDDGLDWLQHLDAPACKALASRHVLPGCLKAADLVQMQLVRTLGGEKLPIAATTRLHVKDAVVLQADLICDNGVIHVIDRVLKA